MPAVMDRFGIFDCLVDPRLDDFDNEQAIRLHHRGIRHSALQIGIAFLDERSLDHRCGYWREAEPGKFVNFHSGGIAATDDFLRNLNSRDADDALLACLQHVVGMTTIADNDAHERWFEFEHGVPRQGHDVCTLAFGGREQDDRPRFE